MLYAKEQYCTYQRWCNQQNELSIESTLLVSATSDNQEVIIICWTSCFVTIKIAAKIRSARAARVALIDDRQPEVSHEFHPEKTFMRHFSPFSHSYDWEHSSIIKVKLWLAQWQHFIRVERVRCLNDHHISSGNLVCINMHSHLPLCISFCRDLSTLILNLKISINSFPDFIYLVWIFWPLWPSKLMFVFVLESGTTSAVRTQMLKIWRVGFNGPLIHASSLSLTDKLCRFAVVYSILRTKPGRCISLCEREWELYLFRKGYFLARNWEKSNIIFCESRPVHLFRNKECDVRPFFILRSDDTSQSRT